MDAGSVGKKRKGTDEHWWLGHDARAVACNWRLRLSFLNCCRLPHCGRLMLL
jgi:hypothetical protein